MIRLGSVPYLNAKPLLWGLRHHPDVEVRLAVPSALPAMLAAGDVDAILVSCIEALRRPDLAVIPGVGIGSTGAVWSVRLFHRVPLSEIETLCLDESSMTSNQLAQILLREQQGIEPQTIVLPPDLPTMLEHADAAVVIGDLGMAEPPPGVAALDLGQAWTDFTGLPFVWAVWLARPDRAEELTSVLVDSAREGTGSIQEVAQVHAADHGFTPEFAAHYFTEAIEFEFTAAHERGLARFGELSANLRPFSPLTN
ncbi:MAG: menaquinone biosynthesis protein [Chthonomonas sp.]|nr:menaquinone biosynthesis protein [Chthonomonas sp.]